VKTTVDLRLIEEAEAHDLRFRCDDCVYFDENAETCAHEYPVAEHRPPALSPGMRVVFCKEFELGQSDAVS
jgi:hypothetical protein